MTKQVVLTKFRAKNDTQTSTRWSPMVPNSPCWWTVSFLFTCRVAGVGVLHLPMPRLKPSSCGTKETWHWRTSAGNSWPWRWVATETRWRMIVALFFNSIWFARQHGLLLRVIHKTEVTSSQISLSTCANLLGLESLWLKELQLDSPPIFRTASICTESSSARPAAIAVPSSLTSFSGPSSCFSPRSSCPPSSNSSRPGDTFLPRCVWLTYTWQIDRVTLFRECKLFFRSLTGTSYQLLLYRAYVNLHVLFNRAILCIEYIALPFSGTYIYITFSLLCALLGAAVTCDFSQVGSIKVIFKEERKVRLLPHIYHISILNIYYHISTRICFCTKWVNSSSVPDVFVQCSYS